MKRFFDVRLGRRGWVAAGVGLLSFFVIAFLIPVSVAHAAEATTPLQDLGTAIGLGPQPSLPILLARLIRTFLGFLGFILLFIVMRAGFIYINSQGDPAKLKKAKDGIRDAVIGLVIILSSYSIASFILGQLLRVANGPGSVVSVTQKYTEPLAGSLGAGIVETHYPFRGAVDIPRNTMIMVTFKEPIRPSTIISGWSENCDDTCSTNLDVSAVQIFIAGQDPETDALGTDEVLATVSEDHKTFVFKPKNYLGNPNTETIYSVNLSPNIKKDDGSSAFIGTNSAGYGWSFTVSTVIDLTPPRVVSVIPSAAQSHARNMMVEITFNEPMDPVSASGLFTSGDAAKNFTNIEVMSQKPGESEPTRVSGAYVIANGYKTVGFVTGEACGVDPCGGTIYCLPGGSSLTVRAKAASIDASNPPQGVLTNARYDGVVDAAGNSLDGNGDGAACGSANDAATCAGGATDDHYTWAFQTTNSVDLTAPKIESLHPNILEGEIDPVGDLTLTFNTLLSAASVNSTSVSLWPDPAYVLWFGVTKSDIGATQGAEPTQSVIHITHPPLITESDCGVLSDGANNCAYWPVVTQQVKGANQICLFPASGPTSATGDQPYCAGTDATKPYCCNGVASATACTTGSPNNQILPVR